MPSPLAPDRTQRASSTRTCMTMFHDASSHVANCGVGILDRSTGNGFPGAGVASHEPCQQDNRLMPNLGTGIGRQNIDEVHHHVCDAKRLGSDCSQERP
jgi:hypothetical protein